MHYFGDFNNQHDPLSKAGNAGYSPQAAYELPGIKELSNPFNFIDGSLVHDKEGWQLPGDCVRIFVFSNKFRQERF